MSNMELDPFQFQVQASTMICASFLASRFFVHRILLLCAFPYHVNFFQWLSRSNMPMFLERQVVNVDLQEENFDWDLLLLGACFSRNLCHFFLLVAWLQVVLCVVLVRVGYILVIPYFHIHLNISSMLRYLSIFFHSSFKLHEEGFLINGQFRGYDL